RFLVILGNSTDLSDPTLRRAKPYLVSRLKLTALSQDANAQHIAILRTVPYCCRVDRRAAHWTERVDAPIAAVGCCLEVGCGFSGHSECFARNRYRHPEGRSGTGLAIGTMTNHHLAGIDFAFDGDRAAVTSTVDLHGAGPLSSTDASIASMSASERPKWWPISCTSTCSTIAPSVSSCSAQ